MVVLTRVQSAWHTHTMQRRVTARDMGLIPVTAAQGREAEQAGLSGCSEAQNFLPIVVFG